MRTAKNMQMAFVNYPAAWSIQHMDEVFSSTAYLITAEDGVLRLK